VVWFGDAPPHGVEPHGDNFAAGCPCGHQWYAQVEACREMGTTVYAIGCLPNLRRYKAAEGVYRTVARTTTGMFLPLREAGLLVPLIAGAAETELDKQRVEEHVYEALLSQQALLAQTDEAERVRWLTQALHHAQVRPRAMAFEHEGAVAAPLRFRPLEQGDVQSALDRLRVAGRVAI
jgi:hypothetical protein